MNAPSLVREDRLTLVPQLASIRSAGEWLQNVCARFGVPPKSTGRLDLCLHEVLVNALTHGGASKHQEPILIALRVSEHESGGEARLEVADAGIAFDPLSSAPRTSAQSLETAEPGGLGLVMIKSNSDLLEYKRESGLNFLHITVAWQRSGT